MRSLRKRIVVWINVQGGLKLALVAVMVALLVYMLSYQLPTVKTWSYWSMPLSGKTIALDAGHGGPDGGARSKSGTEEKNITLAIALDLRDYLQQAGAVVVMTRETDTDLAGTHTKGLSKRKTEDLIKRVELVKAHRADLFISIHLNSVPSPIWSGAQTFYDTGGHPDNKWLATLLQDQLKINTANTNRLANTVQNKYVLKQLDIPAVIVEGGFLSNPQEAELLADVAYQRLIALSLYHGVLRYYSEHEAGRTLHFD